MVTKTSFLAILALFGAFVVMPSAASAASTGTTTTLSKSDEDFLTEMPMDDYPTAEEMQDRDNDGIVDSEQKGGKNYKGASGISLPGEMTGEDDKPAVKYVYKPGSTTELRRSIQDDRIEDGYVQDLMRQRGPQ